MVESKHHISLGKRLRTCSSFRCLGIHPNWEDYSSEEKSAVREAEAVFYPTRLYEDLFLSLGKRVFPRNYNRFKGNKIRQTNLFQLLNIPHPRTRIYYGKQRGVRVLQDFDYPFVGKTPVDSAKGLGVWLIQNEKELNHYLKRHQYQPAYIQEYLSIDRDLRVVLIGGKVIHAYWRISQPGEFRNNVSRGATICCSNIPDDAVEFAVDVARRCCFDEVGLDICRVQDQYYVLEANMSFGLEGFRRAGLNIYEIFTQLDREGWYEHFGSAHTEQDSNS